MSLFLLTKLRSHSGIEITERFSVFLLSAVIQTHVKVRAAGWWVQYLHPLLPQPCLCNVCRMWFCVVLLKYTGSYLKTCGPEGRACYSKILMCFAASVLRSNDCKWPLRSLIQPQTITDPGDGLLTVYGWLFWSSHHTLFHCVMLHPRCPEISILPLKKVNVKLLVKCCILDLYTLKRPFSFLELFNYIIST